MDGPDIEKPPRQFIPAEALGEEGPEAREILMELLPPAFQVEQRQDAGDEALVLDIRAGEQVEVLFEAKFAYRGPESLRRSSAASCSSPTAISASTPSTPTTTTRRSSRTPTATS